VRKKKARGTQASAAGQTDAIETLAEQALRMPAAMTEDRIHRLCVMVTMTQVG